MGWLSIPGIDWAKAGGDSFVQLWTGLNLAAIAWDKYQDVLKLPERKCTQIIEATTCNILESQQQTQIASVFVRWSKFPTWLLQWLGRICWLCAAAAFLLGVYLLYVAQCGAWDWILVLPTIVYVVISAFCLGIFWIWTRFIAYCSKIVGPGTGAQVAKEIGELDQATRRQ